MIGKKLSPILEEIEMTLLEFAANENTGTPEFTNEGFRASIYIFMTALLDKMFKLQEDENMELNTRIDMTERAGKELRNLIKKFTDIDTHKMH